MAADTGVKIVIPWSKASLLKGRKVTIDVESIFFIKKLVLKNLDMVLI